MLISIIIPVYNVEKYLHDCLDSLLNQTYSDFEVLAVDDGSTDNSLKILNSYTDKDHRIKVLHKQNTGVSDSRNVGIRIAKGDYLTFIDSDDWVGPDFLTNAVNILKKYSPKIMFNRWLIEDKGRTLDEFKSGPLCEWNESDAVMELCKQELFGWGAVAAFYRKDVIEENRFPVDICFAEDLAFKYNAIKISKTEILYSPIADYHYVRRASSACRSYDIIKKSDSLKVIEKIMYSESLDVKKMLFYREYIPRKLEFVIIGQISKNEQENELAKSYRNDIIRKWVELLRSHELSFATVIKLFIILLPKPLGRMASMAYKRRKGY